MSTTPNLNCAVRFAETDAQTGADPCILSFFLPAGRAGVLRSADLAENGGRLAQLKFPPINRGFFEQNEVALFGGVFPQYILAVLDRGRALAVWNPAIFSTDVADESELWRTGFPIDQSHFDRRLGGETGYALGIQRVGNTDKEIVMPSPKSSNPPENEKS